MWYSRSYMLFSLEIWLRVIERLLFCFHVFLLEAVCQRVTGNVWLNISLLKHEYWNHNRMLLGHSSPSRKSIPYLSIKTHAKYIKMIKSSICIKYNYTLTLWFNKSKIDQSSYLWWFYFMKCYLMTNK